MLYWPPVQRVLKTGPVSGAVCSLAWMGIVLIFGTDYLKIFVDMMYICKASPVNFDSINISAWNGYRYDRKTRSGSREHSPTIS